MKKFSLQLVSLLAVFVFLVPVVFADTAGDVSAITAPLTRIYDLVKGVISVGAVLVVTYAGARFMTSGDNLQAREASKSMLTYAVMGLVIVWVAPLLVNFLTAPVVP